MKTTWFPKTSFVSKHITSEGKDFNFIALQGVHCSDCFRSLAVTISKDNPEYIYIDECVCKKDLK